MLRLRTSLLLLVASFPGDGFFSCNSELPPYHDPTELFRVEPSGLYVLSAQDNSLKVILTVINSFDETLDGEAVLEGTVRISLARSPDYEKNDSVDDANLIQVRSYNPSTKHLTLDAGDSIRFLYSWNFIDDSGRDLRQEVFRYIRDTTCVERDRRIAVKETFLLSGEVNVFQRTRLAKSKIAIFNICHVNSWVNTAICPPILPSMCK